jgi:hypothetical protein
MIVQFGTNSYRAASLPVSAQRCVNYFAERQPPDAKTPVALYGAPGTVTVVTCGAGPIRGMHIMGGLLYVVSGQRLYSVTSTWVATDVGGNITGTGVVSMDDNGSELVIVNGTNGYLYSTTIGFVLISDADFNAANTVAFFDQRFVYDEAGTNRFFISASLDGLSYDSSQIASAESRPDNVVAVVLNSQVLYVFGERSIETWQDVGAANFPFERVPGGVVERGIAAALATAKEDNTIFFLGDDRIFYRIDGLTPKRVSTHAIEAEWQGYATVTDAFAIAYTFAGHKFVALTFPVENTTWVHDVSTGLWHERESWDINGTSLGRWRGSSSIAFAGKSLIGDAFSGEVGYLDADTFTEFGNTIRSYAISPPIHSDRQRVTNSRFELDIEAGVGLITGQGSDPQIMMKYSDDGGRTWSREMWRSMGAIGEYKTRCRWLRLGQARQRVYQIAISDPVKRTIIAAHVDLEVGQ